MDNFTTIDIGLLSNEILQTSLLFFRDDGSQIRESLINEIIASPTDIIALDFKNVTVIDFSCSDEIVVALQENNTWLNGKKIVLINLSESHKENIHSALEKKKLGIWVINDDRTFLIGKLPNHLTKILHRVLINQQITARELSNDLQDEITNISMKLGNLYKKGMLLRAESKTSEGMEYVYKSLV
ncbi:hypothetical protein J7E81_08925 [Bacillus sp. ISL-18]|uniref:hypothetical protein n=1 Tax=Bacillus sp. ISL-18 TaxID=2819118 RepID=UPI001BEA5797|nr:hypothetical protein [Bacillus sp. ISL-18]MBT2655358.1 hypothetical protein [Bacillus sp. ISL-18]